MFKSDLFFKDRTNVECDDISNIKTNFNTAILTRTKKNPVGTEKPSLFITHYMNL